MSIDLRSFAIPLNADPVRAIRADPVLWEQACYLPPFGSRLGDEELPDISRALLAVMPAGSGWADHFGDRSFDQAEYLLDPVAYRRDRNWEQRERTMPHRIIHGDEVFAEHATTGQGFHWRCSTATFLATDAQQIHVLDAAAVRRQFSVAEMDDLYLYKVHREENDQEVFDRVLANLQALAEHYRTVAAQGLDLIITRI